MPLKKPSELFDKKETFGIFEKPEANPHITEAYSKFISKFETVNEISEKTKIFEEVDILSERLEVLSKEISEKLSKNDLENVMLSQMMVVDENFKQLQTQIKGLNKEDLSQFKKTVSDFSEIVDNLVEVEIPKYKKKITKNEVFVGEQVKQLQGVIVENINDIREEIDNKIEDVVEVIDNNINYFNQQLQETSSQVKKTTETYQNLSKIVENKVLKENEKLDEYSILIENLSQAFENLSILLKEELFISSQQNEEKFEDYKKEVNNFQTEYQSSINVKLEDYRKELTDVKADVVINEQHIKNVDKYFQDHHQELVELKEEVFNEIEKLPVGNLQENIERLEKKIDYIRETYSKIKPEVVVKEVIKEGLLNEPPETKNSDPLTPLDKNFVTLDQLQNHYTLFINRIQQQLSTLGGGGEYRFRFLDGIVGIKTNPGAYDGKFLQWNSSSNEAEFKNVVIPSAQINSDWNSTTGISSILNKPTIVSQIVPGIGITISPSNGIGTVTINGIGVSIGTAPPSNTVAYPLWYDNNLGRGFIYYNDGNSSQWVDFSPSNNAPSATVTNITTITGSTSYYAATANDDYIGVNANVPVTIDLPISPVPGKKIIVKDEGNKISTYNITVRAGSGASVENDTSVVMNINHQSFTYFYNGQNWFLI